MFAHTLLTTVFYAGSVLSVALDTTKTNIVSPPEFSPVFEEFSVVSIEDELGFDPWTYLPPARVDNRTETHTCIIDNRPLEFHCRTALDQWQIDTNSKDEVEIHVGRCKSITYGYCQSVVCTALDYDVLIPVYELLGTAWSLLKSRCGMFGSGGVWEPNG